MSSGFYSETNPPPFNQAPTSAVDFPLDGLTVGTSQLVTSGGNVGVGTTLPAARFHAAGITRVSDPTNSTAVAIDASTTAGLTSITAQYGGSQLALGSAGLERVRIDAAGNVGVGTNSPTTKIDALTNNASGFNWVSSRNTTAAGGFGAGFLAASGVGNAVFYMTGNGIAFVENSTANPIVFATSNLERARIDASGMVGVGITPSPWPTSWRAIDVERGGALFGTLALSGMANNAYFDSGSNWRYKTSYGAATVSMASDGSVSINNAAAGTAGNVITFATRFYIDPTGRVGIGATDPTNLLDVNANSIRVRTARTPASATAAGSAGEICWDANYVYVCVATNTWKRSALTTW